MIYVLIVLFVLSITVLSFIIKGKITNAIKESGTQTVGTKAIPLIWVHNDKLLKNYKNENVSIYGFYYHPSKKKIYGIRHWQGWEYIGYTQIPLNQLRLNKNFKYQKMGLVTDKYQVEYKTGEPTVIVVGWVFIPSKGVYAIYWNEKTSRFGTIKSDLLIDTEDPQKYYQ